MNRKRRLRIWRRLRAEMKKPFAERRANKHGQKPCSSAEMMGHGHIYCPYIPLIISGQRDSEAEKYRKAKRAAASIRFQMKVEAFIDKALV